MKFSGDYGTNAKWANCTSLVSLSLNNPMSMLSPHLLYPQ